MPYRNVGYFEPGEGEGEGEGEGGKQFPYGIPGIPSDSGIPAI
jgi:hypothetical protein